MSIAIEKKTKAKAVARKISGATVGSRIDELSALREKKRALQADLDLLDKEYADIEQELMTLLEAQGVEKATGKLATASVGSSVSASVQDWDKLNEYIKKTGYFHLYQRRISDASYRELLESKGSVPGIDPFTKKRLNLRNL